MKLGSVVTGIEHSVPVGKKVGLLTIEFDGSEKITIPAELLRDVPSDPPGKIDPGAPA